MEAPAAARRRLGRYDLPVYATAKVHRDHHIEVAKALYSVPGDLIGEHVDVRADRRLVRIFHRGQLVKVHPRQAPGGRSTDPDDLPTEKTAYTMRDLDRLRRMAASHGEAVGVYAAALLDTPLPWTKMRQVYALLGLVKKWGAERVDAAGALEHEVVNVGLIGRMLDRGTEHTTIQPSLPGTVITGRFARDPDHFALGTTKPPHPSIDPDSPRRSEAICEAGFAPIWLGTLDERADGHARAQSVAAAGEARTLLGHAPRTARPRPHRRSRSRRVLGTGPGRRSHPPREQFR